MAKRLDFSSTLVSEVMTPHPTMVHMDDKALDCLGIMIERHFRHLPVRRVSSYCSPVGDTIIRKCDDNHAGTRAGIELAVSWKP